MSDHPQQVYVHVCPAPRPKSLPLSTKCCVGFGWTTVTCNGKEVWSEPPHLEWDDAPTLRKFENMARKRSRARWEIEFYAPLSGATYRRVKGEWIMVAKNQGFA